MEPETSSVQPVMPAPISPEGPQVPQPKKSKTGLVVGLIVGSVLLITGIGALLYFFVFAPKNEPAKKTDVAQNTQKNTEQKPADTTPKGVPGCLTATEAGELGSVSDFKPYGYIWGDSYFFMADKIAFYTEYASSHTQALDKLAAWAKKYADKKFAININPTVQDTTVDAVGAQLGKQRGEYIRDQLVQRGVSSSKIVIKDTIAVSSADDNTKTAYRNVNLDVSGDASCQQ